MTTQIKRATLADLDALAPLFDAYRVFYQQPSDPVRARSFLRERLDREDSAILLATHGGAALGFTQLYPLLSSVRTGRLWLLNDLYVQAPGRRKGIGLALLDAAAGFARDDGAIGLMLETGVDNAPARALYRAAGWQEEHTQWYSLAV